MIKRKNAKIKTGIEGKRKGFEKISNPFHVLTLILYHNRKLFNLQYIT